MGITGRIGRIIRSNLNDMLSRAEDPQKQLDQALLDMEQALRDAKQVLVQQLGEEKRMQRELDAADENVREWQDRANRAVDAGRDDLAREALRKSRTYEDLGNQLDAQLAEQQKAVDSLRAEYRLLEQRIEEARERRREIGRELQRRRMTRPAEPGARQVDSTPLRDRSAFDKFEEMADRVHQFEAETEARAELDQYLRAEDDLAAQIDQLGGGSSPADADRRAREERDLSLELELEEMKRRAGRPSAPPADA
ncbi:MAG TPA: hypothetical protein DCZ72_13570, partial [Armatimonadetes bacterium]|nr:hypothetical protein [Armatimonadota bacterium]